ncbi:hypothetical protein E5358_08630 [Palleniella muris]|uniref:Uncharacterized protein n=1 Tax=Palleniella muris TaxID=3038145 RepID=A0AC61QQ12_9BACT|nr:caspase family protein [Palleniella muris]TGX82113.1 hypothetical protein E5358_08630 [Palleniella muris]
MNIKRRLLIIPNDGGTGNHLNGVAKDIENTVSFFTSNEGGAWETSEIVRLPNRPLLSVVKTALYDARKTADYVLVIFTGHGYETPDGIIKFELNNLASISIGDIRSVISPVPLLIIGDCCRVIYKERIFEAKSQIRMFSHGGAVQPREYYRRQYDNALSALQPDAFQYGLSCSRDESSQDTSSGGLYLTSLYETAGRVASAELNDTSFIIRSFAYVHDRAEQAVSRNRYSQHPQRGGDSQSIFPFVVF